MAVWAEDSPRDRVYFNHVKNLLENGTAVGAQCSMGSQQLVLDQDGSLYPCFQRRDLKLGNLLDESNLRLVAALDRLSEADRLELHNAVCAQLGCACLLERGESRDASYAH